jgi:beta-glucosidase-like glycosyl hydrolase
LVTTRDYATSDCDALSDGASHRYIETHFNGSLQVQAQQAIRGGTDLNCGALVSGLQVQQATVSPDLYTDQLLSATFCTWILNQYGEQNAAAVESGLLREAELDTSLVRIYTKAIQLGILDGPAPTNPNPYTMIGPEVVDSPAHRALAMEGALQV